MPQHRRSLAPRSSLLLPGAAGALLLAAALAPACGGRVVVDPIDEGGEGGGGTTTTGPTTTTITPTTTTTTTTTTTGMGGSGGAGPTTLDEEWLGEVGPGFNAFYFDVPPDTLGFAVIVQADPAPISFDQLGIEAIFAPDGGTLFTNYTLPPTAWTYAWYGITVAGAPQSDSPLVMPNITPGQWVATIQDPSGAPTTGTASYWLRRTVDGQFHGGVLDVNVFIAGNTTTQEYLEEMLLQAYSGYAGLELGTVSFYELEPSWAVIQGSQEFLEVLEETSAAWRRPALNVIAVTDLAGDLDQAAGVAAGIPGTGVNLGTHSSGVVMEVFEDFYFDEIILEHEGGHLAGLFHTSEFGNSGQDPLSDTGFCPNPENGGNCPDTDNVMFPFGSDAKLRTPMQDRVIHGSTLYRGVYAPGELPEPPLPAPTVVHAPGGLQPFAVVDLSGRARARAPRQAPDRAWAAGLSRGAERALSGVWCHGGAPMDHFDVLRLAGGDDPAQLVAIGTDPSAPLQVRKRALAAAGRSAPPEEVVSILAAIAESAEAPRQVRIGALRGLEAAGAPEAAAVAQRLGGGDAILAEVARRMLRGR